MKRATLESRDPLYDSNVHTQYCLLLSSNLQGSDKGDKGSPGQWSCSEQTYDIPDTSLTTSNPTFVYCKGSGTPFVFNAKCTYTSSNSYVIQPLADPDTFSGATCQGGYYAAKAAKNLYGNTAGITVPTNVKLTMTCCELVNFAS